MAKKVLVFAILVQFALAVPGQTVKIEQEVSKAGRALNIFWSDNFTHIGLAFQPPTSIKAYQHGIQSSCGYLPPNNAFYCSADRSIYYHAPFLGSLRTQHGNFAIPCVMAHEYGHFITASLNIRFKFSIDEELCADCLSGAFMAWFSDRLDLKNGEFVQGGRTFFSLADWKGYPWFAAGAHGRPEQRARAFFHGYFSGYQSCFKQGRQGIF